MKPLFRFLSSCLLFCLGTGNYTIAQVNQANETELPILGWYSIPPEYGTVARYEEMKAAGFNISFSFLKNLNEVQKSLDSSLKAGMKVVIGCPELKNYTSSTVNQFKNHPALAGYFLRDEPSIADFKELGEWAKLINSFDSLHFCYVNLFPNYANARQLGTEDYKEYVNRFAAEIPLQFLSYDSYPLTAAEDIFSKWHQNLEIIAATAKTSGKPFWAFAQSVLFDNKHEMPSLATLRLQQYTNLAYGAQGLQYFTYWTPVSTTENFRNAPLSLTGQRSPLYDLVKTLNQEIKAVSRVFLGSKLVSVHYAGNLIPKGCSRLSLLPKGLQVLETGGKTLLVSELENKGQRYLVMVNNDYMQTLRLNILGQEQLKRVLKDGSEVSLSTKENSFDVEPGDVVILKMI